MENHMISNVAWLFVFLSGDHSLKSFQQCQLGYFICFIEKEKENQRYPQTLDIKMARCRF